MEKLAFTLYIYVLAPLSQGLLKLFAPLLGGKLKDFVQGKRQGNFHLLKAEEELQQLSPIWIHASSGEIEYARPVLRELSEKFPDIPLLVTYSSPSAVAMLKNIPGISWGPVPWESPNEIQKFLKRFRPRCLLVARTDLWPALINEAHCAQIPSLMFSATFAQTSSRLRGFGKLLTGFSLRKLSKLQVVSDQDLINLGDLGSRTSSEVAGDTRFDQVFHRLAHPKRLQEELRPPSGPVLVAGSTWPEDEEPLIEAFKNSTWRMILAPHETNATHLESLRRQLTGAGLSYRHYSEGGSWTERVLLVDQVGILAELYTWGDLAFVGGSFKKQIHSVMEPLAAGLRVLVGPFHHNNREALAFKHIVLNQKSLVTETSSAAELLAELRGFSVVETPREDVRNLVRERQGATNHIMEWLHSQGCLKNK